MKYKRLPKIIADVLMIDKDVPLIQERSPRTITRYPFKNMIRGDSFFSPNSEATTVKMAVTAFRVSEHGRNLSHRFIVRDWIEYEEDGTATRGHRCWRVE